MKRQKAEQKTRERLNAAKAKIENTAPVQLQPTITSPIAEKSVQPEKKIGKFAPFVDLIYLDSFTCPTCNRTARIRAGKRAVVTCTAGCQTSYHTNCWNNTLKYDLITIQR